MNTQPESAMFRVYQCLHDHFFELRGLRFVDHIPSSNWLSGDQFEEKLQTDDYITICCENTKYPETTTYIHILKHPNPISGDTDKIRRLINNTPGYKNDDSIEIIIISRDYFDSTRDKTMRLMAKPTAEIYNVPYRYVIANPFNHMYCVDHIILTKHEKSDLLKWFIISQKDLKKISYMDRCAFWIGAKKGDIILTKGRGDTGVVVDYREVE